MRFQRKVSGKGMGIPSSLGLALVVSVAITLLGAMIIAALIASGKIGEGAMQYGVMGVLAISAASGAWVASAIAKRLRLQMCMIAGGCYYLVLLAMTALFFGGRYQGVILHAIIILIACGVIAFLPSKNGSKIRRRKKAYR
ncbi:MAG: TIGR04086 family membrane protein [Ruminococcaceae bacterium]|nr:TIGR04086 family membrane protein [Oscillospiraceae bacterium]